MITLDVQLNGGRFSQYTNFPFNSMVRFGERFLGAGPSGLFEIGANTDNGAPINAMFELPTTDLGVHQMKRIRFVYLGLEAEGKLEFLVTTDQQVGKTEVYRVENVKPSGQQRIRFSIMRAQYGRYFTTALRNVAGADFKIDRIEALPVVLSSGITR